MDCPQAGLLYIFNLIVGTGALTLPKAFLEAGWLLSSILIVIMALMSYITATFVIESIALCGFIKEWEVAKTMDRRTVLADEPESNPEEVTDSTEKSLMLPQSRALIDSFISEPPKYSLDVKIELSEMAKIVFDRTGQLMFYLCLCIYLFGDLTIYSAAIAKTLVDASCTNFNATASVDTLCWTSYSFTQRTMYKFFLSIFLLLFGPFVFFNVQKTKYLQVFTSVSRWLTFSVMIGLAVGQLHSSEEHGSPPLAVFTGLPALIGSSVYSFMCHHSLPGIIAPIANKTLLFRYLAYDYFIILIFYLTLALTAIFAFPFVFDLYTLNFKPDPSASLFYQILAYILTLFPVYTLTTSFPIISVTLRENLRAMFSGFQWRIFHTVGLPVFTVVTPIVAAMSTENIEGLVSITGSFAGVVVQYVVPAYVVILSRKRIPENLRNIANPYASPFRSSLWPLGVLLWSVISFGLVVQNLIARRKF